MGVVSEYSTYFSSACSIATGRYTYIYVENNRYTINGIPNLKMLLTSDIYYH